MISVFLISETAFTSYYSLLSETMRITLKIMAAYTGNT